MDVVVIASFVNFAVAISIVYFAFRKPLALFLVKRSDEVGSSIREAEALSKEATRDLAHWEEQSKTSAEQAKGLLSDAEIQVKKMRELTLNSAKNEAFRLNKDAKLIAHSEMLKAKVALCNELMEKSVHLAAQYLGSNLNENDRNKLVSEYVEKVSHGHSR